MLLSSDNVAANTLARITFNDGGFDKFISHINKKAMYLEMVNINLVDSTGLSIENTLTASEIMILIKEYIKVDYDSICKMSLLHKRTIQVTEEGASKFLEIIIF